MNVYVIGEVYPEGMAWIRSRGLIDVATVHPVSIEPKRFFRGFENFVVVLVGGFWGRRDAHDIVEFLISRQGCVIADQTRAEHESMGG